MREDFLNNLKEECNYTVTENGAIALKSTMNGMLDAFGTLGAMKDSNEDDILRVWDNAFYEDPKLAMRLLFYIRDIRGGQGMRRIFRIIVNHLTKSHPELITNNFDNFVFFGRCDDLISLMSTPVEDAMIKYITKVLNADMNSVVEGGDCSLMAKWMPSINTSSKETRAIANRILKKMGMNAKEYRQMLSILRNRIGIVETKMSQNRWDEIDYSKLPAKAAMLYRESFMRHDNDGYIEYLIAAAEGKAKVNAASLFPFDIIHKVMNERQTIVNEHLFDAMWNNLPNYFEEKEETGICVVDTSGSMYGTPMEVAISLGMYCADKAKGPFANHFITFSSNPALQEIRGNNIYDKVRSMSTGDWSMNTDLEKVFELILNTAITNHTPQEDLPSKLYIISDMQFDAATMDYSGRYNLKTGHYANETYINKETFMETMSKRFEDAGYTMPSLIYWNVRASNCGMFQEKYNAGNCCMVSGYSASLFKAIIEGAEYVEETKEDGTVQTIEKLDPITIMLNTLNNERYDRVYVG